MSHHRQLTTDESVVTKKNVRRVDPNVGWNDHRASTILADQLPTKPSEIYEEPPKAVSNVAGGWVTTACQHRIWKIYSQRLVSVIVNNKYV
jgi:hypothetical protein